MSDEPYYPDFRLFLLVTASITGSRLLTAATAADAHHAAGRHVTSN